MEKSKKSKIEPVHIEEARKLKALFKDRTKLSQANFGAEFELGTQGMVWQYLNAASPLNLASAIKFARGLDCSVSDFSPRLSLELSSLPVVKHATEIRQALHPAAQHKDDEHELSEFVLGLAMRIEKLDIQGKIRILSTLLDIEQPENKDQQSTEIAKLVNSFTAAKGM